MMEDLITDLRNKTAMCRFTRGEVVVVLSYLEDGGYLAFPDINGPDEALIPYQQVAAQIAANLPDDEPHV